MALTPTNIQFNARLTNIGTVLNQAGASVNLSTPNFAAAASLSGAGIQVQNLSINGMNVSTALPTIASLTGILGSAGPKVVPHIIKTVTEGDLAFPGAITAVAIEHADKMVHDVWKELGGKVPLTGKTIGDQLFKGGLDPIKFIKQFDPMNSSGIFPDVLNIMDQLKSTAKQALDQAIAPLQSILGSSLLGNLNSISSLLSSIAKTEDNADKVDEVILLIISTAMGRLALEDPELALTAAGNLNSKEIENITRSYYKEQEYTSDAMPEKFILYINEAIAVVRLTKGVKVNG